MYRDLTLTSRHIQKNRISSSKWILQKWNLSVYSFVHEAHSSNYLQRRFICN